MSNKQLINDIKQFYFISIHEPDEPGALADNYIAKANIERNIINIMGSSSIRYWCGLRPPTSSVEGRSP